MTFSGTRVEAFRRWFTCEQQKDKLFSDITADDLTAWAVDAGCLEGILDLPESGQTLQGFLAAHDFPDAGSVPFP